VGHLPQCPSDRNQVWNNCTGVYGYPDGSRYFGEFTSAEGWTHRVYGTEENS
jgi:hypothetical protein